MSSTRKRKKAFYVQANSKKKVRMICQFTYLYISVQRKNKLSTVVSGEHSRSKTSAIIALVLLREC